MAQNKDSSKSPTFCALPWVHRFTNIGGEIQVCCSSEERDNNVRDDEGRPINASSTSMTDAEIMNTSYMKNLRRQMLDGKWPEICHRCKVTEEVGGISRRQSENLHFVDVVDNLANHTEVDGKIEPKILSSDFRLGNLCNLACRMCNPRSSSRWIKDWNKIDQDLFKLSESRAIILSNFNWYKTPKFLEQFEKQLPTLRHLHFAGGEPLIVPEMLQFLKLCVESGHASHIELTYNTNITQISKELKALWPKFKGVRLLCSIDGFGAVNEFIRYPSKWHNIDKNLKDIDSNFKEYGIIEVLLMCTVQVYNVFRLGDLFDYAALNFKNISQIPHMVDLHYPHYYSTQILPESLKIQANNELLRVLALTEKRLQDGMIPSHRASILEALRGTINFLNLEDKSDHIVEFFRSAKSIDGFRKQNVTDIIPELLPLFQNVMKKSIASVDVTL